MNVRSLMILWWFFVLIINGYSGNGGGVANAKVCGEVDARNDPSSLEAQLRNCTIVSGSVSINLIEKKNSTININKISFPELR